MRKFTSALLLATTLLASFVAFATDDKKQEATPNTVKPADITASETTEEPSKDKQ
jgi:hypothetical protein